MRALALVLFPLAFIASATALVLHDYVFIGTLTGVFAAALSVAAVKGLE